MQMYDVPRCKSCGDALDISDPNAQYIVCKSCGCTNLKSDAMEALNQAKAEIMSWLRQAIPAGINVEQTETMDPIARHNIFMTNVRPSVESEFREYRFGFINILSNQLIAMPFRTLKSINVKHEPKLLFTFDSKIKSVQSLAVDDEAKLTIRTASDVTYAYGLVMNNVNLLAEQTDGRYHYMANNFRNSVQALDGLHEYEIVKKRFDALSLSCDGIAEVVENKSMQAIPKLNEGLKKLEEAKTESMSSLDFGSMSTAISKEIVVVKTVISIADTVCKCPELDSGSVLQTTASMVGELSRQEKLGTPGFEVQFRRPERYTETFAEFSKILAAKAGSGTVKIAKGSGDTLVPFWVVEVKYSFETGSLWKKRSVEVSETTLISAEFTTRDDIITNPNGGITDVFSIRPQKKIFDGIKGNETAISMGGEVKNVADSAISSHISGMKVMPPMSTAQEAEIKAEAYLNSHKASHPQLRMGKSTAKELIYLPVTISSGNIGVSFGQVPINGIGNLDTMRKISL